MNFLTAGLIHDAAAAEVLDAQDDRAPALVPLADHDLGQLVRSAAHAAECNMAVYLRGSDDGFEIDTCFGPGADAVTPAMAQAAMRLMGRRADDLLIVNDVAHHPWARSADAALFDDAAASPPMRFLALAKVIDATGSVQGALLVADPAPRAGLSPAKTYVLRTHAAQIAARVELHRLRLMAEGKHKAEPPQSATERLRLLESVVVNANDAVLITRAEPIDLPGPQIVYCNAAFTRTTGYSEAEVIGRTPRILQSSKTDRAVLDKLRMALSQWKPIEVELLNTRKDGTEFWVELSIVPVANEKGWFTHWVSVQRDVSERKAAEETAMRARIAEAENLALEAEIQERRRIEAQLLYTAFHDDLTRLRNRAFFMDRLRVALARANSDPGFACAVLFMDLDRFKLVNDSLGHRAGDLLLMDVAERLRGCTRPQDTLARIGGDEFALLVEGVHEVAILAALAGRVIDAMRPPLWISQQEIFPSCSIGVVQASKHHRQPEELLRDADIAMYQAKRHDTGGYAVFAGSMHDSAVKALELQTDLRNALARDEFVLHYQPICDTVTARIRGVEALVRWQHPTRGLVPPGAFIGAAEETGLIRELGRWVLHEACRQMRAWRDRFPETDLRLSVNTSGEELKDPRFVDGVRDLLADTGLDPRVLQLEVTEAIFLQDPEYIAGILDGLRALGVRIALDDFGTGYSSLSYLDRYRLDTIKIDRSFVTRMLTQRRTWEIVTAIVKLGQALDLDIVAEGVEDETQRQAIRATGCGFVQGYLLGRPASAADFARTLEASDEATQTRPRE
ncbi:putative bifunctional diguanylate cyclase/phosphodiesterase [Methylobacterium iners]|uniref:Diguanylate cyclase n=1 Tax=Methylobacterium iners TaxID=418707 RepID=A0ABQ4S3F9_9HYPH|nr:EAL domain-containing protein [Methylobacterium iners]GJD97671.1 hypothetical protein OCOJLMKI_4904 [Methylobacterium iners]